MTILYCWTNNRFKSSYQVIKSQYYLFSCRITERNQIYALAVNVSVAITQFLWMVFFKPSYYIFCWIHPMPFAWRWMVHTTVAWLFPLHDFDSIMCLWYLHTQPKTADCLLNSAPKLWTLFQKERTKIQGEKQFGSGLPSIMAFEFKHLSTAWGFIGLGFIAGIFK